MPNGLLNQVMNPMGAILASGSSNPPVPTPPTPSPVDQQALNLTHALALTESGANYNSGITDKGGDAGTSFGAYQWHGANGGKDHFASDAIAAGLNPNDYSPENQDKVAYAKVLKWKQKGYQPAQIASMWNSGQPQNYQNHSGTTVINGQTIPYDTPAYVQKVKANYQKLSGQQNQNGYVTPPPSPTITPPTDDSSQLPGDQYSIGNIAKGVGNFLFPIVSDVANDVQGKSNKSFLQQTGDAALSALPFIPGLGEGADAAIDTARVGEGAVEGADVASKAGLLTNLLGKTGATMAKGAATGYGIGVASNLSQGKSVGQAFSPNATNLLSTAIGGTTPLILKGAGSLLNKFSGISPQIQNALQDSGISVDDYEKYMNAAKANATDVRAPAPLTLAADDLDHASAKIDQNVQQAGKAVGAAKASLGNVKLPDISNVSQDFASRVAKDYGLQITQDPQGIVHAISLPDRTPSIDPPEVTRLEAVAQNLAGLKGSTAQNATDVISKLDNSINYAKGANKGFDPIESLLLQTRSGLDNTVRSVAPDLASANDRYSQLAGLQKEVSGMAGGQNQRGDLLMKRIFSGDKSGAVQDLFDKIKGETGIDLTNSAALAKHATETVGSQTQKTLLQQTIEGGVKSGGGISLPGLVWNAGKGIVQNTIANPESIGKDIVAGESQGMLKKLIMNQGTKATIEGSRLLTK